MVLTVPAEAGRVFGGFSPSLFGLTGGSGSGNGVSMLQGVDLQDPLPYSQRLMVAAQLRPLVSYLHMMMLLCCYVMLCYEVSCLVRNGLHRTGPEQLLPPPQHDCHCLA
jgi:hypothetical protein